jgi:hypothetical protein
MSDQHLESESGLTTESIPSKEELQLWNPMASAYWSLLLSPLFGATLLDRNWREMGKHDSARQTRFLMWATGLFAVLSVVHAFTDTSQSTDKVIQGISKIVGLVLTAFCFSIGRRQRDFLKDSLKSDYRKRAWGKALAIGFSAVLGFIGIVVLGAVSFSNPAKEDVATESKQVISSFFQRTPTYSVSSVEKVLITDRKGHDYYGVVELTMSGQRIRQSLHVHLEGGNLQWDTKPMAGPGGPL